MPPSTVFCKHYRAMSDNTTCAAGVAYETLKGIPFEQRPCFWRYGRKEPNGGCHLMEMPTPEELAEDEARMAKRLEAMGKARRAIVEHLGPFKKGRNGAGVIDCPVCGVAESLRFSRAGYNGHIHAQCRTADCVSWME